MSRSLFVCHRTRRILFWGDLLCDALLHMHGWGGKWAGARAWRDSDGRVVRWPLSMFPGKIPDGIICFRGTEFTLVESADGEPLGYFMWISPV